MEIENIDNITNTLGNCDTVIQDNVEKLVFYINRALDRSYPRPLKWQDYENWFASSSITEVMLYI